MRGGGAGERQKIIKVPSSVGKSPKLGGRSSEIKRSPKFQRVPKTKKNSDSFSFYEDLKT